MIEIVEVSARNESAAAHHLAASIRAAWPDVAENPADRITIATGISAIRDIDLFVTIELAEPRALNWIPRRNGTISPAASVQAAALVIAVNHLDRSHFAIVGSDIFPDYGSGPHRGLGARVNDAVYRLRALRARYHVDPFYIHGVAWLSDVSEAELAGIMPTIVGSNAGWLEILDAAAQQSGALHGPKSPEYMRAIGVVREALTPRRPVTARERRKADELEADKGAHEFVAALASDASTKQIRLTGPAGSGKTTALMLLAQTLASDGDRVLILAPHEALRGEIEHRLTTIIQTPGLVGRKIAVATRADFVQDWVDVLSADSLAEAADVLARASERVVARVKSSDPIRFDFDHIFVDDAQDVSDAERDFLRVVYGYRNFVLADGVEPLVRAQPCDWASGVPKGERLARNLVRSQRLASNLARFATAFALEAGFEGEIEPAERSTGGRIIVLTGPVDYAALFRALRRMIAEDGGVPLDGLVCVPDHLIITAPSGRREFIATREVAAAGEKLWQGCDPLASAIAPGEREAWRLVPYDACRGLEGLLTVTLGLDKLDPGSDETNIAAARRLVTALTRSVQTLVIGIEDEHAPLVSWIRAAEAELQSGVVNWYSQSVPGDFAAAIPLASPAR